MQKELHNMPTKFLKKINKAGGLYMKNWDYPKTIRCGNSGIPF
jgi:hypothetical protein